MLMVIVVAGDLLMLNSDKSLLFALFWVSSDSSTGSLCKYFLSRCGWSVLSCSESNC